MLLRLASRHAIGRTLFYEETKIVRKIVSFASSMVMGGNCDGDSCFVLLSYYSAPLKFCYCDRWGVGCAVCGGGGLTFSLPIRLWPGTF